MANGITVAHYVQPGELFHYLASTTELEATAWQRTVQQSLDPPRNRPKQVIGGRRFTCYLRLTSLSIVRLEAPVRKYYTALRYTADLYIDGEEGKEYLGPVSGKITHDGHLYGFYNLESVEWEHEQLNITAHFWDKLTEWNEADREERRRREEVL
jgi:hypothetical protein